MNIGNCLPNNGWTFYRAERLNRLSEQFSTYRCLHSALWLWAILRILIQGIIETPQVQTFWFTLINYAMFDLIERLAARFDNSVLTIQHDLHVLYTYRACSMMVAIKIEKPGEHRVVEDCAGN